jgi:hypothetical protein
MNNETTTTNTNAATYSTPHGAIPLITLACTSIGLFCCIEMIFLVTITFRRYSGLYFWSIVGGTCSQFLVCWSVVLLYWISEPSQPAAWLTLAAIGYLLYVPFEFLVLYSRLHLLLTSKRTLNWVLGAIVMESLVAEIPLTTLMILNTLHPDSQRVLSIYTTWWLAESVLYTVVDVMLCGVYFLQCKRLWGDDNRMTRVLWHVIAMVIILFIIDVAYVVLSFTADQQLTTGFVVCERTTCVI